MGGGDNPPPHFSKRGRSTQSLTIEAFLAIYYNFIIIPKKINFKDHYLPLRNQWAFESFPSLAIMMLRPCL